MPKPLPKWHKDTPINRAEDGISPAFPYENIVFEGGGVKGTIYAGALEEVERRGGYKHIKRVAGASAGSFIATYVAIGMTVAEVRDELRNLDFEYLSADPAGAAGFFKNLKRLKSDFGLHTGYDASFSLHMAPNFLIQNHSPNVSQHFAFFGPSTRDSKSRSTGFIIRSSTHSLTRSCPLSFSFFLLEIVSSNISEMSLRSTQACATSPSARCTSGSGVISASSALISRTRYSYRHTVCLHHFEIAFAHVRLLLFLTCDRRVAAEWGALSPQDAPKHARASRHAHLWRISNLFPSVEGDRPCRQRKRLHRWRLLLKLPDPRL